MVTTRRRAKQEPAQEPDASADAQQSVQPGDAATADKPNKVPWYLYTAPAENFELHPDDDEDVPAPIQFFLLPAAIAFFMIWGLIAGKPVWPPVCDFEC